MVLRSARRAGFTILEILIAIVVLVLGITGIIALFPTAIESGNKTVEDSYAAAITQSVVDALTVGVRESRYTTLPLGGRVYTYFVFNHDGVLDQPPLSPHTFDAAPPDPGKKQGSMWRRDFCVVLPQPIIDESSAPNTNSANEPNFMYPVPSYVRDTEQESVKETDPGLNQRAPGRLSSFGSLVDNLHPGFLRPATAGGQMVPWVSRVFELGRYRDPPDSSDPSYTALPLGPGGVQMVKGDIRLEYRGDAISMGGTSKADTIAIDPYPSYSFAFTLQRARVDTSGGAGGVPDGQLTGADQFSNSLYTLRVMIFKNFDAEAAYEMRPGTGTSHQASPAADPGASVPKNNIPIREFVTLIAM